MAKFKRFEFNISGMTCKGCEATVAGLLKRAGAQEVKVDFAEGKAWVAINPEDTSVTRLVAEINGSGHYRMKDWREESNTKSVSAGNTVQHIIIIGGGSAAFAAAIRAAELGVSVTMVNEGLPIGGTCVNVGCVPSKTLIRAAATWYRCRSFEFEGISCTPGHLDFARVIAQKNALVTSLRQQKYQDVLKNYPQIQFISGWGKIENPYTVRVNHQRIQGDRIIIATGASPKIPNIPGIHQVPYLTSTSAMALTEVPDSLIVLGGRFVALELAQMFHRFGSQVTLLQRSERILPQLPPSVSEELTQHLVAEGVVIQTGVQLLKIEGNLQEITVQFQQKGKQQTLRARKLLVATGRQPNSHNLGLDQLGIQRKANQGILVDDYLQTTVPGIFAAGDVLGEHMFVYTAAYEGKLAAENAIQGFHKKRDYSILPWVVFTDPQVAGVGLDEQTARDQGIPAETVVLPLSEVPRALAARDTRGMIQLVRNTQTDQLIGGHVVAAEGGEIIMEIAMAIRAGVTTAQLAETFHPYLTLSEGIKLAALSFRKDIHQLSCCAT